MCIHGPFRMDAVSSTSSSHCTWHKKKIKEAIKVRVDFTPEKLESHSMIFSLPLFVISRVMRNNHLMEKSLEDEMMVSHARTSHIVSSMHTFAPLKISSHLRWSSQPFCMPLPVLFKYQFFLSFYRSSLAHIIIINKLSTKFLTTCIYKKREAVTRE